MVYRHSWLAGGASIALAFYGLNRLLRPTVEGPQWQLVVLAGLILGALITWAAVSYRLATIWVIAFNATALFLAAVRFTTPETTAFIFPTGASLRIMGTELSRATDVIQNGVEPVVPIIGLVVIVTAVFWAIGALLVWGLLNGHPFIALLPRSSWRSSSPPWTATRPAWSSSPFSRRSSEHRSWPSTSMNVTGEPGEWLTRVGGQHPSGTLRHRSRAR